MSTHDYSAASSSNWVWKINQLLPIPPNYPLERTAVKIENLPLETVTARISEFMKNQSITCSYHSKKGRVYCLTDCLLKFVVQLWQGDDSANDDCIIIEVQRRRGCGLEMVKRRHQLIQAVRTGKHRKLNSNKHVRKTSSEHLETLLDTSPLFLPPREECLNEALRICQQLLASENLDENRLGLESLHILTDPSRTNPIDSDRAARTVLSDSLFYCIIEKYFKNVELIHFEPVDDDDGYAMLEYEQGQFFGCLHLLALEVLSQALEIAVWKNISSHIMIDLTLSFWGTVLQALYCNLRVASQRPLEASLSIRCLRFLQILEPTLLIMASDQSRLYLRDLLVSAHHYGRQRSLSLEQETLRLMEQLGFVH